jgi:hypothetical protein
MTDWVLLRNRPAVTVVITSRSWEHAPFEEVVIDGVRVRDVTVDVATAARLADDLLTWCFLPLEELATTPFRGEYELAASPGMTLTLRFEHASKPDAAQLFVTVGQSRLTCRVDCVVDVTGCSDFAREFSGCLAELGSRGS